MACTASSWLIWGTIFISGRICFLPNLIWRFLRLILKLYPWDTFSSISLKESSMYLIIAWCFDWLVTSRHSRGGRLDSDEQHASLYLFDVSSSYRSVNGEKAPKQIEFWTGYWILFTTARNGCVSMGDGTMVQWIYNRMMWNVSYCTWQVQVIDVSLNIHIPFTRPTASDVMCMKDRHDSLIDWCRPEFNTVRYWHFRGGTVVELWLLNNPSCTVNPHAGFVAYT